MRGGDALEEKHVADVVCGSVSAGSVLGCKRTSAVRGRGGVDSNAGGAGRIVSAVGAVVAGVVRVPGFLDVVSVGSCSGSRGKERCVWWRMYRYVWMARSG